MYLMRCQGSVCLTLVWICCGIVALQASKALAGDYIVQTTAGPVQGKNETLATGKFVLKYLGIPFAKAKRFENPSDPESWNTTRNATAFGKICPQPSKNPSAPLENLANTSEECLFINVFVPSQKGNSSGLTVMVWIHGGGYLIGAGGLATYDGGVLASEEGVIVVTFNYRLGALGFLSTGKDGNLKGNYGMMDQIHALKWVNKNIEKFGGSPNNVTLFGESAGGMSVSLHMLSPLTDGLYKNAIMQSGATPALFTALMEDEANDRAKMFANALGCSDLSDLKNCAAEKNISDIINAQMKVKSRMFLTGFAPVVDGTFLKEFPLKLLKDGNYKSKGSVLIGVTRDEGTTRTVYFPGLQEAIPNIDQGLKYSDFKRRVNETTWVRDQNDQILESILQEYTDWGNTDDDNATRKSFIDANSDAMFKAPAVLSAQLYVTKGMRTFFYQLDYSSVKDENNNTIPEWKRVPHTADLKYVFGLPLLKYPNAINNIDVEFSKIFMKYWATFAKTGDPNPSSQNAIAWPAYTSADQKYLSLMPEPKMESKLLSDKMNFWNSYLGTLKTEKKEPCPKDLTAELEEKDDIILGLAIAVGVLGLLVIIFLIVIICLKMRTRSLTFHHKEG